jgi:epoxyqueuosine reductase
MIARSLGFDLCGISRATALDHEAPKLEEWLRRGYQGKMQYLENHRELRLDPTKLVPEAKSVISLGFNYAPKERLAQKDNYKISKYAYGQDYHKVLKKKLKQFILLLREEIGEIQGRGFVDSAPVMERQWAAASGLGWIGKHGLLLNRNLGSFFFLSELIIDLELEPDSPVNEYCGTCTRCMDACPTDAFPRAGVLDGSKCISYLTIELRDAIPEAFRGKMENWIFGCDICQDVCPWNRFAKPTQEAAFEAKESLVAMNKQKWEEVTEELFNDLFKKSPVRRTGYAGLKRNIDFIKKPAQGGL